MRIIVAGLLAASLMATQALAAGEAPLPAGKAAGTKKAQEADNTVFFLLGAGVLAVGVLALSNGNSNSKLISGTTPPTTTT